MIGTINPYPGFAFPRTFQGGPDLEALILAAGRGNRMLRLTKTEPKCMLEVGGKSLVRRQVDVLRDLGIRDITVVGGYARDALQAHLGDGFRMVHNEDYATTNSLYSFWLGLRELRGEFIVLNADVLFHPALLGRLIRCPYPDALLAEFADSLGDEEMKIKVEDGYLVDIDRALPDGEYDGENLGIVKFSDESRQVLSEVVGRLVAEGNQRADFPLVTKTLLARRRIRVLGTEGLPWIEVDFPEDLERARREIMPRLSAVVPSETPTREERPSIR